MKASSFLRRLNMVMSDNNDETNITPIRGRPFQKGQSGNPAGGNKPRLYKTAMGGKISIEELYKQEAGRVFYELMRVILDPKTPATAKISGMKEFNDRAFGKAPTSLRVARVDDTYDTIDVASLSTEVLQAISAARISNESE